jgi:hypothetical protein
VSKLFGQGFNGAEAAATLTGVAKPGWLASVPGLAERVRAVRSSDLNTRDGRLMMLFFAAAIINGGPEYSGHLYHPARMAAPAILGGLGLGERT